MEEVRSHWQVASIQHFCTLFQKPFKLPSFEPEELEQAFIIDVPEPPKSNPSSLNSIIKNDDKNERLDSNDGDEVQEQDGSESDNDEQNQKQSGMGSRRSSSDYTPSLETRNPDQQLQQQQQQQNEDQQELHLLVKLAIALIKPHFNTKIR